MNQVILHITSGDDQIQKRLFTQINNIRRELPECEIEVVAHAAAARMMLNHPGIFAAEIKEYIGRKVAFAVCKNSLNPLNAADQDLISGVKVVNSALAHIILHQQQSWAYIKIGN